MSTPIIAKKKAAVKKNGTHKTTAITAVSKEQTLPAIGKEGIFEKVAVAAIDFSPLNYRKYYSQAALDSFAGEVAVHGIISPVTLRKMPSGRYELVAGERRLRAALIAGLTELPAIIKVLTDAEVIEIQLAENLQRENPHAMEEAQAIGQMQKVHMSIEKIAGRLGKSKTFVYSRIKFLDLTEPMQEMFFADAINMQEAFDIAALSAESQQELFEQHCADWKEITNFKIHNLRYVLSRYKYDLNNAPFNIKDKKLIPNMGACTNCPFNTATLKSLFPELSKEATCTNRDCYQSKCNAQFIQMFTTEFAAQPPQALLYEWGLSDRIKKLLNSITGVAELPTYGKNEVTVINAPVKPEREDYFETGYGLEDDEYDGAEEETPEFNEAGYQIALQEYEADTEEYNQLIQSSDLFKALLVSETKVVPVLFLLGVSSAPTNNGAVVSAKEVQEAIKTGNATPELLVLEIGRLNSREQRAKELDSEKVHVNIHTAFVELNKDMNNVNALTTADLVAARLLVYQSLDWSTRSSVKDVLFNAENRELPIYEIMEKLTEQQYSYMIRKAIAGKSESKLPGNDTGEVLQKVAESAGVNIAQIEQEQQEKTDKRTEKLQQRISDLQKKIDILERTRPTGEELETDKNQ
ncbi:ParB/RepB/Spo0J family partition protein [Mucilaginibacter gracilis]|uniref:ParB/RepB/Spo0J family partition protein n=1 Tax=Mucilaginibacter gracilis TaxID=423350 RepID=A0A495IX89_9SPHI|nr:ParB/RepB/Spo0J family partition protein [Mucilaginibacter gracilis]RKR80668.1 ParB/RepB/Spo0J family partition protein [Mucilaginibacter gracilis]